MSSFRRAIVIGRHKSRQSGWHQWPGRTRRSGKRSVFLGGSGLLFELWFPPDWFFFWSENYGWFWVVVGLLHNSLKSLLHWRWQNFWLTVQTGISDLELVFVSHSFPMWMSEAALLVWNSMDSIPADKVLKRKQLDLQKRFPMYHVCHKCLVAHFCGSAFL